MPSLPAPADGHCWERNKLLSLKGEVKDAVFELSTSSLLKDTRSKMLILVFCSAWLHYVPESGVTEHITNNALGYFIKHKKSSLLTGPILLVV